MTKKKPVKSNAEHVPKTKLCPQCDESIRMSARRCKHCGSYLDWQHVVAWFVPACASLVAVALGIPTLINVYQAALTSPKSDLRQVSVSWSGDQLKTVFLNLGEEPALVRHWLSCEEAGVADHPITLSAFRVDPDEPNRSTGAGLAVFPNAESTTEIFWSVWSASVEGAQDVMLNSETVEVAKDTYGALLDGIEDITTQEFDELWAAGTDVMTTSELLDFEDAADVFPPLSMVAILSGVRPPALEYAFSCSYAVEDPNGLVTLAPFNLSFEPFGSGRAWSGLKVSESDAP